MALSMCEEVREASAFERENNGDVIVERSRCCALLFCLCAVLKADLGLRRRALGRCQWLGVVEIGVWFSDAADYLESRFL